MAGISAHPDSRQILQVSEEVHLKEGKKGVKVCSCLFWQTMSILHTCTTVYEIPYLFVTASALGHKEAGRKSIEIRT